MSTLAEIRDRVEAKLLDTTNVVWSTDTIDEAIRAALDEYSLALPYTKDEVITLLADGREIDVSGITGLLKVTQVHWPYDSTTEDWPPQQVRGFYLYWNDGAPVLYLNNIDGDQPQTGDEVRVWYVVRQAIEDLDLAAATTVPAVHESLIVLGAAALSVDTRSLDLLRITEIDPGLVSKYEKWAEARLKEFRASLELLRGEQARCGSSWGEGWSIDKWDGG
jgi:hypothetical protein